MAKIVIPEAKKSTTTKTNRTSKSDGPPLMDDWFGGPLVSPYHDKERNFCYAVADCGYGLMFGRFKIGDAGWVLAKSVPMSDAQIAAQGADLIKLIKARM